MSKIAILKSFPTPNDVRQNVQDLGQMLAETLERLDSTALQVQSLEQLPDLVADQVTKSLEPLHSLRLEVIKVLAAYDQVVSAQRSSLEAMSTEMSSRTVAAMETKTAALSEVITGLSKQTNGLKTSIAAVQESTAKLSALPADLRETTQYSAKLMRNQAKELMSATDLARPTVLRTLSLTLSSAVLGSLLVVAGQSALSKLLPQSSDAQTQKSADWAAAVWSKSTEEEKKSLNAIASRPAK